jgi:hypothetical protein
MGLKKKRSMSGQKAWLKTRMKKTKVIIVGGGFGTALRLDKTLARRVDVE